MPGPFDYDAAYKAVSSPGDASAMQSPGGIAGLMRGANAAGAAQVGAIAPGMMNGTPVATPIAQPPVGGTPGVRRTLPIGRRPGG
jgi:hypothetical protein